VWPLETFCFKSGLGRPTPPRHSIPPILASNRNEKGKIVDEYPQYKLVERWVRNYTATRPEEEPSLFLNTTER
jgi:hypothetical protein